MTHKMAGAAYDALKAWGHAGLAIVQASPTFFDHWTWLVTFRDKRDGQPRICVYYSKSFGILSHPYIPNAEPRSPKRHYIPIPPPCDQDIELPL